MILITGASGNNGSELIKLLSERDMSVRAMSRKPPALTNLESSSCRRISTTWPASAARSKVSIKVVAEERDRSQ